MTASDSANELAALELLEAALGLAPALRESYVAGRDDCPTAVRERALELLLSDRDAIAGLQTGGAGMSLYGNDDVAPDIPGYRILRQLGRGGMGAVWLAERAADDFDHIVAIKVIRPGVLSDGLIERFRRERQILAQLNHPHIARLYDGGQTEENQPYIVMEHVAGQSLRNWMAGDPPPALAERLRLFRQIAVAVGFAHQNLVVHRDLTPGNVLVDDQGQAKLIDFGIARPPRADAEQSPVSAITGLSLTPGFAAPERALGAGSNTLADIYSLGRILEEMLGTGEEPELRAIAARAAAPDPADRYPGVGDLIDDLDRHAAGRAIDTYSTSRRYRFARFVKREKVLVASGAALFLALTIGFAASSWSYLRAERARVQSEQRFDEVRELANFMLYDLYDELEPVIGNTRALTRIADRASGYLDTLADERNADPQLRLEAANGYKRLSDVLGNPDSPNLGRREEAGAALRRSVAMLEALHRAYPQDAAITRSLARALHAQSVYIFIADDDNEGALAPARRSAALWRSLAAIREATTDDQARELDARLQALRPLVWLDQGERAVTGMAALEADAGRLARAHPREVAILKVEARVTTQLASAMSWTYDLNDQMTEYRRSLPVATRGVAMHRALIARFPADRDARFGLLSALLTRALIHFDLEEWESAERDLAEAEQRGEAMLAKDPDDSDLTRRLQTYRSQRAPILIQLGRDEEGIALARRVLAERSALLAREPDNPGYRRDHASAQAFVGETLLLAGRDTEGCAAYALAAKAWREIAQRMKIDPLNQSNDIEPIEKALRVCRSKGIA